MSLAPTCSRRRASTPSCSSGRARRPSRQRPDLWLWCLALLCAALATPAQADPPPPFVINGQLESARVTVYSEHLLDDTGEIEFNDILSGAYDRQFVPALRSSEFLGFSDQRWWIRLALHNDTAAPQPLLLSITPGLYARISFYRPDARGLYQTSHGGTDLPLPWGDLRARTPVYALTLPPGATETYYFSVVPERHMNYTLHLNSVEYQLQSSLWNDGVFLLLCGVVLGLVLYNFAQSLLYRNTVHFHYSLFLSALLITLLTGGGFLGYQYLPAAGLQPHLEAFAALLTITTSTAFSRAFLNSRTLLPGAEPWLLGMIIVAGVGAPLSWMLPSLLALQIVQGLAIINAIMLLWLGMACWLRQGELAGLYLVARLPLILAALLSILAGFAIVPITLDGPLLVLACTTFEAMLFALGLSRKSRDDLRQTLREQQEEAITAATWHARSETLARLSHEIRTPMSGVLGMAEILRDTPLTPNQKECVRGIQNAGESLLKILNDVLEYSRLEQGHTELEQLRFDLNELVMDAVELFREKAEEKQIELIPHVHTNVPQQVEGDPNRIKQVLTNILGACIRHAQPGELVIDVARDASGRADHLRFEFEGSALQQAGDAFSALTPHDTTDDDNGDSTRLGLSIARQLVDVMEGRCGVRYGRAGPASWFVLPLPAMVDPGVVEGDDATLQGRSILVVDDSSTMTRVIRQQALAWGMRVTASHDPREALASIRTQANLNDPYDVVLLDQRMPGMTGMQLAARVHEDPLITRTPILVMLTGINDAPTATAARNVGIHRVLGKPVSGNRLRQALAEELGAASRRKTPDLRDQAPDPGLRILVAEDHQLSQKVIRGMLAKLGLDGDVVANGREAFEAVRDGRYDLVLMDCEMPEMDGFEAARRIRDWERMHDRKAVPIIALTAHILREHRERSLAAGMNAHVPKPVELDVLRQAIVQFTAGDGMLSGSGHASDETPG
ncbi:sensor histidine kinase/response regulator [Alcanivorax sp. S71-1-4]|uniref:hybrid sensor histidine kinase/response regulator n=1 Tax=Alcanivorax sp. S71-1-4 TaxID=1177159 RepID=UPI0016A6051C|nr:hybrid sensor histidine kinase/response regulator [Alcanivorax sp. S71-1-4]KAF0809765.1 sensor histidine kinase/response regulator [Alcanivorax sp. S71-1-4]